MTEYDATGSSEGGLLEPAPVLRASGSVGLRTNGKIGFRASTKMGLRASGGLGVRTSAARAQREALPDGSAVGSNGASGLRASVASRFGEPQPDPVKDA